MSNQVFPASIAGLTWTVLKQPSFNTIVQTSPNKYETRVAQTVNPIWRWTLLWDYLRDDPSRLSAGVTTTDLQTLMGFFLARTGQYDSFLFTDPSDLNNGNVCYVGPAISGGVPNTQAELQLVNDGAGNYYSPVQRSWGGLFQEDITDLNGGITVYANGVLQAGGGVKYTVEGPGVAFPGYAFMGLVLAWTPAAPVPAAPALSAVASGSLSAATYYVRITYLTTYGETTGSVETSLAVAANNVLQVASPSAYSGVTGWNVYVSTSGAETKQNALPISIGTNWTEPTSGLITGAALPGSNTSGYVPATPITAQFNYYYRVRFPGDDMDFENWAYLWWTIGGSQSKNGKGTLELMSARPPTS